MTGLMHDSRSELEALALSLRGWKTPSSDLEFMDGHRRNCPTPLLPASVLIPLIRRRNTHNVILTKRAQGLARHAGQVAFPGGKKEEQDTSMEATALREANEEIGLDPGSVRVLGSCPTHQTSTGFLIHPFVGLVLMDFHPRPQPGEVDEVFEVPLSFLLNLENYRIESRSWKGSTRHFFVVPFGPYQIWGATAHILHGLARRHKELCS